MQCLTDFVDAQLNYYNNCSKILQDLSKQIGGVGLGTSNNATRINPATINNLNNHGSLSSSFTSKKKAKVLFDYEATDPSEISVSANQVSNKKKFRKMRRVKYFKFKLFLFKDNWRSNSSKW